MEEIELKGTEKVLLRAAIICGILGILIFIVSYILFQHNEDYNSNFKINSEKFGDFGSFLSGVVGTVWALVSVILFYLTLRLQRKELSLQRSELELTRNELQGQKDQMIQQNKTLLVQQFENTFFQLLNVHTSIVNSMDLRRVQDKSSVISEGRDCFKTFHKTLRTCITNTVDEKGQIVILANGGTVTDAIRGYDKFYEENQNNLGHYFRNLYHIVKFIDNSEIENKKTYSSFVRAQLSSHELAILFYNCISHHGKKFKPLVEKYALLKNMNKVLVYNNSHLEEYKKSAFGE